MTQVRWRARSYLYLHLKDEEEVAKTNKDEEASREVGVFFKFRVSTEIYNATTFMVRTVPERHCFPTTADMTATGDLAIIPAQSCGCAVYLRVEVRAKLTTSSYRVTRRCSLHC